MTDWKHVKDMTPDDLAAFEAEMFKEAPLGRAPATVKGISKMTAAEMAAFEREHGIMR